MMRDDHEGGCLCGKVRYRVAGRMRPVVACHCLMCRKTSGHHSAFTAAPRAAVTVDGAVAWYASSPDARRGFCPACGSQLFWDGPDGWLSIAAGSLDGSTGLSMAGHIFTASKGDYYAIRDGLPTAPGADRAVTEMPG